MMLVINDVCFGDDKHLENTCPLPNPTPQLCLFSSVLGKEKKKKTLVLLAPARVCHSDEFSAHIKGVGCEERQKLSDTRGTPSEVDGGGALVFTQEGVCVRNT